MNTVRLHKVFAAMSIVGAIAISQQALGSPDEHPVDGPGPFPYGSHSVNSGISDPVEVDTYTFSGHAGDHARAVISGLSNGFDPQLVLRSPAGSVLNTVNCPTTFTCSTFLDQLLPTDGTYTINVSDAGLNNSGNYSLHLDQYPPTTNWVGFGYASPVQKVLDHPSDSDFFAFQGAVGTIVQVTFAGNTNGLDPHLEIWGPTGTLISDTNCNTTFTCVTSTDDLSLPTSGIYKVGLSDLGFDNIGNYTIGVSCVFGDCPNIIPIPDIPEPSSYALMLAGLGLVGFLARRRRGLPAA